MVPMDLSVVLFTSDRGITPADAAKAAEEAGFHAFYVPEHSHIPTSRDSAAPGDRRESCPTTATCASSTRGSSLATAAAVTSTIRLGTAVALPMEHDPITLAKTLATLDHLSGGRVTLGVGFGWNVEELEDHGVPGEEAAHGAARVPRADAGALEQEVASYDGEFAQLRSRAGPTPSRSSSRASRSSSAPAAPPKNFDWIAANADGWITTPIETDIEERVAALNEAWAGSGREGDPRIVVLLTSRLEPGQLERWAGARRRRGDVRPARQGAPTRSSGSSPRWAPS